MKKLIINITEEQINMLKALQEKFAVPTISEVVRRVIPESYDSYLNNYKEVAKAKIATAKTPEEKVKVQVEREQMRIQAREQSKVDKQVSFCRKMGGKETADGYCEYSQFVEEQGETIAIIPQREPLESMHERAGDYQFLSVWADEKTPASQRARIMEIGKKQKNLHVQLPDSND